MSEPRELTPEECREAFLRQVRACIGEWQGIVESGQKSPRDAISGVVHSVLCILDGVSGLPGFAVVPRPAAEDREYHQEMDENWWPEHSLPQEAVDIAGSLHEGLYWKADGTRRA